MINWAYYEPLEAPVIPPGRQVECEKGMAKDEQVEAETMEQEKKDVHEIENNEKKAESERRAVVLTQFDVQAQDKSREDASSKRRNDKFANLERDSFLPPQPVN